jgi:type IV secretory pathway VirB4 component
MPEKGESQKIISIDTIRNGIVVLKDGSFKAVLEVEGINFDLKSTEEKDAISESFRSFLISLDFYIQIAIYSSKTKIDDYLEKINKNLESEQNPLLKEQIKDYISFLDNFLKVNNILTKKFYLVIPYHPTIIETNALSGITSALSFKSKQPTQENIDEIFFRAQEQLYIRENIVINGLSRIGLHFKILTTEELVELFYNLYNPQ